MKTIVFLLAVVWSPLSTSVEAPAVASPEYSIISRDVVVQNGDTLSTIAERELGKAAFAPMLAAHNNLEISTSLTPGDIVRIPIQVPPRGEFAEVVFVKGTVTATRTQAVNAGAIPVSTDAAGSVANTTNASNPGITETIVLARNAKVFSGDVITTSDTGYVSIAFSSGSVINMQPDTVATLQGIACLDIDDSCLIEIDTQQGRVTSDVEGRDRQPVEFRINTPYASAAVRGTNFDIDSAEQLLVGVTEGSVDVSALGTTVPLPTGFGLSVQEGEPPGEPVELIPPPVFKRIPARIAQGDTVEWWPFADAVEYQFTLSTDEAGNDTLQSVQIQPESPILALQETLIEPVEPGDYFLTLRAIDFNGLMGFATNTRITVAQIDSDIAPVNTSVVRDGSEFLVTVENRFDEALGYEIQISSDEAFTDPLSVDVNENGTAVFRIDQDQVFTRARVLIDPFTVSEFGDISNN